MSWSHDYWADEGAAKLDREALSRDAKTCPDCPPTAFLPWKLHDVDGVLVCGKHAAKREGLTFQAWESRRKKQARRDRMNPEGKRLRESDMAHSDRRPG